MFRTKLHGLVLNKSQIWCDMQRSMCLQNQSLMRIRELIIDNKNMPLIPKKLKENPSWNIGGKYTVVMTPGFLFLVLVRRAASLPVLVSTWILLLLLLLLLLLSLAKWTNKAYFPSCHQFVHKRKLVCPKQKQAPKMCGLQSGPTPRKRFRIKPHSLVFLPVSHWSFWSALNLHDSFFSYWIESSAVLPDGCCTVNNQAQKLSQFYCRLIYGWVDCEMEWHCYRRKTGGEDHGLTGDWKTNCPGSTFCRHRCGGKIWVTCLPFVPQPPWIKPPPSSHTIGKEHPLTIKDKGA